MDSGTAGQIESQAGGQTNVKANRNSHLVLDIILPCVYLAENAVRWHPGDANANAVVQCVVCSCQELCMILVLALMRLN